MKVNRKYKLRRIAFGISREALAKKANVELIDVIRFESGIRVNENMFNDIKDALYDMVTYVGDLEHIKRRIIELSLRINEEDDKAVALNDILHLEIELERLKRIYGKDLL